jgi:hypothetical protein
MKSGISMPRFVASILATLTFVSVTTPASVRADSKVEDRITEEERLGARSDQYSRTFNKAISALVSGDAATFRALLSSTTVLSETRGPGAVDVIIRDRFIPFFGDFATLTDEIVTVPTYNSVGDSGVAFARSFKTTEGEVKHFVIYLITEGKEKRVVVGNLLPNATEKDLLATRDAKRVEQPKK